MLDWPVEMNLTGQYKSKSAKGTRDMLYEDKQIMIQRQRFKVIQVYLELVVLITIPS